MARELEPYWRRLEEAGLSRRIRSRWQTGRSFPYPTFILREDELGGTKARKYASLIPWLHARGITEVRLRGTSQGNNVLALSLALREAGIRPCYVQEDRPGPPRGNGLLARLTLGPDYHSEIPSTLPSVEIPEGANCEGALAGALSLGLSILENQHELDSIVLDAGTGFSAATLILALSAVGGAAPTVRVVWLGSPHADLDAVLTRWRPAAEALMGPIERMAPYQVVRPSTSASFGSANAAVWREIEFTAQNEGVLLDPLYTAKLFLEARRRQSNGEWGGRSLLIHGGGVLSLLGYGEKLQRYAHKVDKSLTTRKPSEVHGPL